MLLSSLPPLLLSGIYQNTIYRTIRKIKKDRGWAMEMRIGGKEVSSPDDAWIEVKNPATGELIDRVPAGSAGDVAEAVDAAGAGFWKTGKRKECASGG